MDLVGKKPMVTVMIRRLDSTGAAAPVGARIGPGRHCVGRLLRKPSDFSSVTGLHGATAPAAPVAVPAACG
jgi:hypothetical protein